MPPICFYFQVHQPFRLNKFSVFSIGADIDPMEAYFNHALNQEIFEKATRKCYLPTNRLLMELIEEFEGRFKLSFSITGTLLEYSRAINLEVMKSFQDLFRTGSVDLISETYYHSLCSLFDEMDEFREQVEMHRNALKELFDYSPTVFRNTEAIYDNRIARQIEELNFKGIITEGSAKILGWRSPNYLYRPKGSNSLKLLLRNHNLSDDIAFRFSASNWTEYPLTASKFAKWVENCDGALVNVFIDYETFGEHQWEETGIFEFLRYLPKEILKNQHSEFLTVSEAIDRFQPVGEIDVPFAISWADVDRDVSTWLGNEMQVACFNEIRSLEKIVKQRGDPALLKIWRMLQTSDHLYYISTKGLGDGDVHQYFSPYSYPYEAFINYMNILQDFKNRLMES